jgi:hypothetical protein
LYAKRWISPFCTTADFTRAQERAKIAVERILKILMSNTEIVDMMPPPSTTPVIQRNPLVMLDNDEELLRSNAIDGIVGDYTEVDEFLSAEDASLVQVLEALNEDQNGDFEDDEEESDLTNNRFEISCIWEFRTNLRLCDDFSEILPKLANPSKILFPDCSNVKNRHRRETTDPFRRTITIYSNEIAQLSPNRMLTGSLISELSKLLQERFDIQKRCAVFNTFAVDKRLDPNRPLQEQFIAAFKYTEFWEHDVWIFPLNRIEPYLHWTLVAFDLRTAEVHHFDSLAAKHLWEADINVRFCIPI